MTQYALVILAGGASSRMGTPKALLTIKGETFASCIVRKGRAAHAHCVGVTMPTFQVYLITGASHEVLEKELISLSGVRLVRNENFERGQISSIQAGLRSAVAEGAEVVLVWPVDLPLVQQETIELLIRNYESFRMPVTIPVFQDQRGHPVIYDRNAIQTLLLLGADQTAKDLRRIYADETCLVETEDPGVLIDIDTPEDYRKHIRNSHL